MKGTCEVCKKEVTNFTPIQRYCCPGCRDIAHREKRLKKWAEGTTKRRKAENRLGEMKGISVR